MRDPCSLKDAQRCEKKRERNAKEHERNAKEREETQRNVKKREVQESRAKVSKAWESTDGMQRVRSDIEGQIDNRSTDTQSKCNAKQVKSEVCLI
jgi:hypothetical protein